MYSLYYGEWGHIWADADRAMISLNFNIPPSFKTGDCGQALL
jgi:hypothetical protein